MSWRVSLWLKSRWLLGLLLSLLLAPAWGQWNLSLYRVDADGLRLRTAPAGKVVGKLARGDRVLLLERRGDWAKVALSGRALRAWVAWRYLRDDALEADLSSRSFAPPVSGVSSPEAFSGDRALWGLKRVNVAVLRVRASPGGRLLGRLKRGAPVQPLEQRGAWLRVSGTPWQPAWVHGDYLSDVTSTSAMTPNRP